jgi:predicted enzyme related to lactoylglutathione lyase
VGRFAVMSDPQGAVFAIFTPAGQAPGHEGAPELGEFSWHELATTEPPAAFRFYEKLFGWEKTTAMEMGELGTYQMYGRAGVELGGIFPKPPQMPGPPAWLHYIMVDDADKAAEITTASGGTVVNGPMDVPGGDRIAQLMDPHGAFFALHMAAAAARAAPRAKASKPAKAAARPKKAPARKKPTAKKRPAKKASPKKKQPAARKAAKKKSTAKKSTSRKPAKKAATKKTKGKSKSKAKRAKRGR